MSIVLKGEKMNFGLPEIVIILMMVVLLFGVGKISKIGAELGEGIHNFKKAINGDTKEDFNKGE